MGLVAWQDRDLLEVQAVRPARWVRPDLAPGEQVVWQGRPGIVRAFLASIPLAVFGLMFGGMALLGFIGASHAPQGGGGVLVIFTAPSVLVGALVALSPLGVAWQTGRTRYAITNRRAVVREPRFWSGVQTRSFGPDALGNIVRNQRLGGSGDLIFEEFPTRDRGGRRQVIPRGFFAIRDVRGVERLLRSTLLADRVAP